MDTIPLFPTVNFLYVILAFAAFSLYKDFNADIGSSLAA